MMEQIFFFFYIDWSGNLKYCIQPVMMMSGLPTVMKMRQISHSQALHAFSHGNFLQHGHKTQDRCFFSAPNPAAVRCLLERLLFSCVETSCHVVNSSEAHWNILITVDGGHTTSLLD